MNKSRSFFDLARSLVQSQKYFAEDIDLKRYEKNEIGEYISFCCDHRFYVEAYTLALQFINNLIICFVETKQNVRDEQVSTILLTFNSIGLIDNKNYEEYNRIKKIRNDLVHQLLKAPDVQKLLKTKSPNAHKIDLENIIANYELIFLRLVKDYPNRIFDHFNRYKDELLKYVLIKQAFVRASKKGIKVIDDEERFKNQIGIEVKQLLSEMNLPSKIKYEK